MIDAHLAAHETLLPSGFGLADIMLMSCLDWAFHGEDLPEMLGPIASDAFRPAYKKAMAINYANLPEVLDGTAWGIKVLDLTSMVSGPASTMMLADQGLRSSKSSPIMANRCAIWRPA